MIQNLDISTITIKRELQPGDDVTALAEHIQRHGLQVPVAVNSNLELIDGRRRIAALRSLGMTTVSTLICRTFEDAIGELEHSLAHGVEWLKPSPKRVHDVNKILKPLVEKRLRDQRAAAKKGHPPRSKHKMVQPAARPMLVKALGIRTDSYFSEAIHLHNLANDPTDPRHELAKQLAHAVENGELALHGVRARLERGEAFLGVLQTPAEQRRFLESFVRNLAGVIGAAKRLGPLNPKIPKSDLTGYLKEVQDLSRQLANFARTFEQETEK